MESIPRPVEWNRMESWTPFHPFGRVVQQRVPRGARNGVFHFQHPGLVVLLFCATDNTEETTCDGETLGVVCSIHHFLQTSTSAKMTLRRQIILTFLSRSRHYFLTTLLSLNWSSAPGTNRSQHATRNCSAGSRQAQGQGAAFRECSADSRQPSALPCLGGRDSAMEVSVPPRPRRGGTLTGPRTWQAPTSASVSRRRSTLGASSSSRRSSPTA